AVVQVVPDVRAGQVHRLLTGGVAGRGREVPWVDRRDPQRPGDRGRSGRARPARGHYLPPFVAWGWGYRIAAPRPAARGASTTAGGRLATRAGARPGSRSARGI